MKKLALKVALPLVILLVVVTVFWLFILPLPSVQAWARDWIETPNGLTATATLFAAIGTIGAVIVALFGTLFERIKARQDRVEAQKRFEDEQVRAREVLKEEREHFEKAQKAERLRFNAERDEFRLAQEESRKQFVASQQQTQEALEEGRKQSQAALDVAHEQIEQSKRQAQLERFSENRPLLMPEGTPTFQSDKPQWLQWNVNEQSLAIRNIGSGAALNVASVLYGCESYLIDWNTNRRSDHEKSIHWTCWLGVPIASNTSEKATHKIGNGNFYENKMHIGQYGFNAPPEPRYNPNQSQDFLTARITITYLDIFKRKHASIFDYVQHTGGWQLLEFLEDIKEDLHDLEG